ncbi:hypothetical protein MGMO_47c00090 [Methyloglobulus morosus KoM1]|uniref:Winged helix-turn-helix domain-containing protein n=1 Tax=Methyloglobulus morosus KoM1 TaxID=1116472 RepID=V5C2Q8_9GAMM|nr:winged helix-turn-helix domain-containing protein [Methyloglobulus morosus]ESS72742.1 hypothetical protein MGMO_47c00090 [Methyloglobulus morosus KoM1]
MTEVLFTASVAFVGYVIYVLVDEQMSPAKNYIVEVRPEPPAKAIKQPIPKPTRARTKPAKARQVTAIILNLSESVGMAAGSIWHYLNEKGPTAVAKLVKELPESNNTLQRSIGWLAQEDKIALETIGRVETISLKG